MTKDSFVFYRDWHEGLKNLPSEVKVELYDAIVAFALDGIEIELSPTAKIVFGFIRPRIQKDLEKYQNILNIRSEAGRRGAISKEQKKQMLAKVANAAEEKQTQANSASASYNDMICNDMICNDNNEDASASLSARTDSTDSIDYVSIMTHYNEAVHGKAMAKCVKVTEGRKNAIRARIREFGLDQVLLAIDIASASAFLNGHNDKNWRADFDFVFRASSMAKILEHKYDDTTSTTYATDKQNSQSRAIQAGSEAFSDLLQEIEERRRT